MKRSLFLKSLPFFSVALFLAVTSMAQGGPRRNSPAATATGKIGAANVTIAYSSPAVDGRKIWGELVSEKSFDAVASSEGEFIRIFIEDNGIGFDEMYLDKMFTIFQRLHLRSDYEGTGIGLAIVKKIVEKHDGIIGAKSEEGIGATFFIILPVHQKSMQVSTA